MTFYVGQKVVFVGYPEPTSVMAGSRVINRVPWCVVDAVYVVLGTEDRQRYHKGKWAGVSLHLGFVDPAHGPVWHHHSGFRPVVDRETDIAIFREMLNPSKEQVPA